MSKSDSTKLSPWAKDETGNVYGKLTVLEFAYVKREVHWKCRCECGTTCVVAGGNLRRKPFKNRSCIKCRNVRHGKSDTPEYVIWKAMRQRCYNPENKDYKHYGQRGIGICERWGLFEGFIEDMGTQPFPRAEVERRDNSLGYSPENCYWATHKQQARNTRKNVMLTHNGKTQCLSAWCEELGLRYKATYKRIYNRGWSVEKAFTTPLRVRNTSLT